MKLLIKNGTVVDPSTDTVEKKDVLIEDGIVTKLDKEIKSNADTVVDAKDCYVMPGFVDLHVHLRDPGFEYKETVDSGAKAAAKGGYTTICAMPNTKPVVDRPDIVDYVHNKAKNLAPIRVLQIGAITKKQAGRELADIEGMVKAGIPAISEDGKSVMNSGLYEDALKLAAKFDIPVFAHCEDVTLVKGGVMNDDERAKELGLKGISNIVEDSIAIRDIFLAYHTKARLHLCHCSTGLSRYYVEMGRKYGAKVTAEVCPHHFTFSTADIPWDDANYKMNPPLRTEQDKQMIIQGLKDDVFDVIATDHAPHSLEEKTEGFNKSPFGIVGLETAAGLTYTKLVKPEILTIMQMAKKMSYNPARIIGLDRGYITEGAHADIVVFDPNAEWVVDPNNFVSKGRNTPFSGMKLKGEVKATIFEGEVVYSISEDENDN